MKKSVNLLVLIIILLTFATFVYAADPVGIFYRQGENYAGGDIYFLNVYINYTAKTDIDTYAFVIFRTDMLSSDSVFLLKSDISDEYGFGIDVDGYKNNIMNFKKSDGRIYTQEIDRSLSVESLVSTALFNLFDANSVSVASVEYKDARVCLSSTINNIDGHIVYDANTNRLVLNYTYDIQESVETISENGQLNDYLIRTYDTVNYETICMNVNILVDLKETAVVEPSPSPTQSPSSTPDASVSPSKPPEPTPKPSPSPSPTPTPTPSPSPSPSSVQTPGPSPSATLTPSKTDTPQPSGSIKSDEVSSGRYKDIWTYVLLQSFIVLVIVTVIVIKRKKH